MIELVKHRVTPVWLLLVGATALSWWMGTGTQDASNVHQIATLLILVAFIKVRFVIRYFMEVRSAPLALKLATDAWVVLVAGAILTLYWQIV